MFLPLGDAPNPRGTPLVNYALIALNVAVYLLVTVPLAARPVDPSDPALSAYLELVARADGRSIPARQLLAQVSAYDLVVFRHGFRPAAPSLLALLTSMFLHGGLMHLFGNMLFLWIYGDNVEHRLGRLGYLAAYLSTGAAATLFHTAFDRGSQLPLVGASGAISGVLGFYFLFFPRNEVRVLVLLFPLFMNVVKVNARLVLGFYLVLDNILPFLVTRGMGGGGVAYGAHIGGFVGGLASAWLVDRRESAARPREYAGRRAQPPTPERAATGARAVAERIADGRLGEAAQLYFGADEERIARNLAPDAALELGRWLERNGHPSAAVSVFRRVLRHHPHGAVGARAHAAAGRVQLEALGRPAAAWQHFQDALDLDPRGEAGAAARRGIAQIEALQKRQIGRPPRGDDGDGAGRL